MSLRKEGSALQGQRRIFVYSISGQSYLSHSSGGSACRGAAIGLQFAELEAPGFIYRPLYSDPVFEVVRMGATNKFFFFFIKLKKVIHIYTHLNVIQFSILNSINTRIL